MFDKKPFTIQEQIVQLQERGLIFKNPKLAAITDWVNIGL